MNQYVWLEGVNVQHDHANFAGMDGMNHSFVTQSRLEARFRIMPPAGVDAQLVLHVLEQEMNLACERMIAPPAEIVPSADYDVAVEF